MSLLLGFVWLPSVHPDFSAEGLWATICRAAGVPTTWSAAPGGKALSTSTDVVLERSMARPSKTDSVGRGATLALNCTMCHGARGQTDSDAPNLAGQYSEVVIKQLLDYKSGKRSHALMQGLARGLSDQDIRDLATYYAYLPKARTAPTTYDETLAGAGEGGRPAAQHRALHLLSRRRRPEARRALARGHAPGLPRVPIEGFRKRRTG